MDEKALIDERVKLFEEQKALLDANPKGLDAEKQAQYDARSKRMGEIKASLERAEDLRGEEKFLGESRGRKTGTVVSDGAATITPEEQQLAFRGWALGRHATDAMRAAAQKCGFRIDSSHIDMATRVARDADGKEIRSFYPVRADGEGNFRSEEVRALSVGTTTAGGNSVPNEVMRAFYEVQKWYGRVREESLVVQTESGATLPWPTVTDTANTGRVLAEATTATTTTDPTFGVVNLGAFKFSSDAVLVSWELLQDSFIDLSSYLGTALGRRIGRIQNTKFTAGAGTTEPQGIIVGAAAGVTAAVSTAFTLDEVISLIHALDPAYRNLPGTMLMIHDTIAAYLRKFKDGQGRYIWEMSAQVGQPDRLFGYPVSINNDMDSALTTGKKLVLFGNPGLAYIVRDAGAVRFVRSDEKYVLEHQVMFEASQRSTGAVIDSTALKILALA
jgi:HK97 family phage major capsid protein